jgi:hypothetical protein
MKRTTSLLKSSKHWGGKNKAGWRKQWDYFIVLDANRFIEPNDCMIVLLFKRDEKVHIELGK